MITFKRCFKLLVILVCLLPLLTFASMKIEKDNNTELLFVLLSKKGAIHKQKNDPRYYTLTLKGVNPFVIFFTNRPQRYSGKVELNKFISQWNTGAFKKAPPNAVMEAVRLVENDHQPHKRSVSYTVELQNPKYNEQTQTLFFQIRSLAGSGGDKLPDMAHSDYVALFIDNMQACPGCIG